MNKKQPKIKDAASAHKECVFRDSSFILSAKRLVETLGISESRKLESVYYDDAMYFYVGKSAERILTFNEVGEIKELARDFAINLNDLICYLNNGYAGGTDETKQPEVIVEWQPNSGVVIKIPPDATKQDVKDSLRKVEMLKRLFYGQRKATKRKPPQNYELVYAVFRQRVNGKTYRQIFELYQDGTLPLYEGSANQLKSEDSLERYYNKYKPAS